jgi:choline dehydrogenase-like flavoprotein
MSSYDVIVIGSGAGGGTLVHRLAPSGKRILLLERGDWLPREPQNWSAADVFIDNRYISADTWYDGDTAKAFQPQVHYFVGGATKLYGAALYRLRERDFGELRHHDGISPAWPIDYDQMRPHALRDGRIANRCGDPVHDHPPDCRPAAARRSRGARRHGRRRAARGLGLAASSVHRAPEHRDRPGVDRVAALPVLHLRPLLVHDRACVADELPGHAVVYRGR